MRTVYVDFENKCHPSNDGTMIPVEAKIFNGKCDAYIEGFCCEIREGSKAFYPWKHYDELDAAQREYELEMLAECEEALKVVGVEV